MENIYRELCDSELLTKRAKKKKRKKESDHVGNGKIRVGNGGIEFIIFLKTC